MFKLPELEYSYDALEPYIDAKTMEIHHTKHHNAYVTNLNNALESIGKKYDTYKCPCQAIKDLNSFPENIRTTIRNNAGGAYNHNIFFKIIAPGKRDAISSTLLNAINKDFGSLEQFKEIFNQTATKVFGSGWAWLVLDEKKNLKVISTPNQDSPLMQNLIPIAGIDVWEHAYYLKYQNRRPEYITAFWNVLNWDVVSKIYDEKINL